MITFEIERAQYEAIKKKLEHIGDKTPEVLKNAVNDTAKQARKRLALKAQETYSVKAGSLNKAMNIRRATIRRPEAMITAKGEVLPLIDFKTSKNSGRSAAKAKVLKAGSLKELTLKGADRNGKDLKAFIAVMTTKKKTESKRRSNGHKGVFQRIPGSYMKGKAPRTLKNGRRTQGREALKQFMSNSIPKMLGSEERVYGYIKNDIYADLNLYLNKHIARMMEG